MKKKTICALLALVLAALFCTVALAEGEAPGFTIDLTPILQAVIGLLAALITAKVIPWIKSKTTEQQQKTLAMVVDVLVYAAEQIYTSDQAKEKLAYVEGELEKRGYEVDIAAIEAAVRRMNNLPTTT